MAGSAFSFDFSQFGKLADDIGKISKNVEKRQEMAVKLPAQEYANDVKAGAPYKSGTYRRSIHVETTTEGVRPVALIGTDAPYGRRLELGFYGTDAKGRKYQQYPRPHWRPAWDHNLPKYIRMMLAVLDGEKVDITAEFGDYRAEKREERSAAAGIAARLRPDLTGGIR